MRSKVYLCSTWVSALSDDRAHVQPLMSVCLADHNRLSDLTSDTPLDHLRVLRISHNPLDFLYVTFAPKLMTLFVDSARLGCILGTESLRKLENLSVRDQSGDAL